MQALAQHVNLPFVDLDPLKIDAKLAPQLLSRPFARRHTRSSSPPTSARDRRRRRPAGPRRSSRTCRRTSGAKPRSSSSTPSEIQRLITDFYGFRGAVAAAEEQATTGVDIGNLERLVKLNARRGDRGERQPHRLRRRVPLPLRARPARERHAHRAAARHLGRAHAHRRRPPQVHTLPKAVHPAIVSRIKTLARLDIAEKRRPQDGRIKTSRGDREVELRVSTVAVAFGEKLVIRIFDPEASFAICRSSGCSSAAPGRRAVPRAPQRPHPRHRPDRQRQDVDALRALRTVATPEVNVVTIEDPIELVVDAFNQVAVQTKIGIDFAEALRHVLRQDPTSSWSARCATRDGGDRAPGGAHRPPRPRDAPHERRGHRHHAPARARRRPLRPRVDARRRLAQRLVRIVCAQCRVETFLTPDQMSLIGLDVHELARRASRRSSWWPSARAA
jgi:general secretion pathway protein E